MQKETITKVMELVDKILDIYGESNSKYTQVEIANKLADELHLKKKLSADDISKATQLIGYYHTTGTTFNPLMVIDDFEFLAKYFE